MDLISHANTTWYCKFGGLSSAKPFIGKRNLKKSGRGLSASGGFIRLGGLIQKIYSDSYPTPSVDDYVIDPDTPVEAYF
ncbi:MAG: hypothetical protein SRB2_02571 [Desulfobacteraceae bacterium Eth-SRB2]|nr:MAG: hypothetical protein SRB2_02571 [Desulfobacteraceae bacterium Eth-SRB2]